MCPRGCRHLKPSRGRPTYILLVAGKGQVAINAFNGKCSAFIPILQRLNEAFGLELPYSPSYTGLRLILQGVDSTALEAAFRRHAASTPTPPAVEGLTAIAVNGKTPRGSFDAFNGREAAHMMSALRHADRIVLAHVMVAEKSNEIPTAPELIEALGLKGCLFTLDAEHCQKRMARPVCKRLDRGRLCDQSTPTYPAYGLEALAKMEIRASRSS